MRKREIDKQFKVVKSQYERDKLHYDQLKDKDGVIGRHYKSRIENTLKKLEQLK
jgi:hypothetical protein